MTVRRLPRSPYCLQLRAEGVFTVFSGFFPRFMPVGRIFSSPAGEAAGKAPSVQTPGGVFLRHRDDA